MEKLFGQRREHQRLAARGLGLNADMPKVFGAQVAAANAHRDIYALPVAPGSGSVLAAGSQFIVDQSPVDGPAPIA